MNIFSRFLRRLHEEERGITGLETAIILIAFVIVASVFAFVVLSTGLYSAERGKETVFAGLEKARGNLEVRGALTAEAAALGGPVTDVKFNLGLAAGGFPVQIPTDSTLVTTNSIAMNYIDAQNRVPDTGWTRIEVMGDADNLLEVGELFELTVAIPGGSALDPNEIFTVEVIPPSGGALLINRTMPPQLDLVMDLH